MDRIDTEVLVIGGGAAGLRAAIEAAALGKEVAIVSKGKSGKSGNTALAQCNIAVSGFSEKKGDSSSSYIHDALKGGAGINQKNLLRIMAEESKGEILRLQEWGVEFLMSNNTFLLHEAPGHSYPRVIRTALLNYPPRIHGLTMTKPMMKEAKKRNVRFIDGVTVTELIREDDSIKGALGINNKDGKPLLLSSKSLIIAAGGGGRIFRHTNNSLEITGDSYALALNAGAELIDMEFVQFYPTMAIKPVRIPIVSTLLGSGAILKNVKGERFMETYSPDKKEMATRDVTSMAVFKEIVSGRGIQEAVYLDCSGVKNDVFDEKFSDVRELFKKFHIDIQKELILVSPTTHFFMGGIKVDENCQTDIQGVFACGEAVGGVHGANRISGNALTETLVMGARAGRKASEYVDSLGQYRPITSAIPFAVNSETIDRKAGKELRETMWDSVSIIRSKDSLEKAKKIIDAIKDRYKIDTDSPYSTREDNEIRNMLIVAEVIITSSLLREESRGAHFREDIQETKKDHEGNYHLRKENGIIKSSFSTIV
jgi:succinate dehydrogenase/fumarate reductase flavoprotein subunit